MGSSIGFIFHAGAYEQLKPLEFEIKAAKRKNKGSDLCWFRELGEMSEWGSWIWSNGIWG